MPAKGSNLTGKAVAWALIYSYAVPPWVSGRLVPFRLHQASVGPLQPTLWAMAEGPGTEFLQTGWILKIAAEPVV